MQPRVSLIFGSIHVRKTWFGIAYSYWVMAALLVLFSITVMRQIIFSVLAAIPLLAGRFLTDIDLHMLPSYILYSQFANTYLHANPSHSKIRLRPLGYGRKL